MSLIETLERQYQNNEQTLASSIAVPKLDLDAELINRFVRFAKERGVRYCPAAPSTVAAYVHFLHDHGAPQDSILQSLEAIEVAHHQIGASNPVATPVTREALREVLVLEAPNSWPGPAKLLWAVLPEDIRAVISKREKDTTRYIRKLQSDNAELRKQISNKEGIDNVTSDQKGS